MTETTSDSSSVALSAGGWRPPEGLKDHADQPILSEAVFFAPPPKEIGRLLSADSTYAPEGRVKKNSPRMQLLMAGIGLLACIILFVVLLVTGQTLFEASSITGGIAVFVILLIVSVALLQKGLDRTCAYVGEDGVALFRFKGKQPTSPQGEILIFAKAAELRTKFTRHKDSFGNLTATEYRLVWTDAAGGKLLQMHGFGAPNVDRKLHIAQTVLSDFATAAEHAWSSFLLKQALAGLEKQGYIQFNLDAQHWVRVAEGSLEISIKGQQQRCTLADIKSMSLSNGVFHIVTKDAKWFSSKGNFSFSYAEMANAQLFMLAVHNLFGRDFG